MKTNNSTIYKKEANEKLVVSVIGAGIGGLVAAIRLAEMGYRVNVFEQSSCAGGKVKEFHQDGFRFDTGPSLFTLPELLLDIISREPSGKDIPFAFHRLEESCRYFYPDGSDFIAWDNQELLLEEVRKKTADHPESMRKFLDDARFLYELVADVFIFKPFSNLFSNPASSKVLKHIGRLDSFRSLYMAASKVFHDEKLRKIFSRYATYNGSNPYKAPATLKLIAHLEHNKGAFFPEKGMYSIVSALMNRAERLPISFHFNRKVTGLSAENRKIKSIRCDDAEFMTDIVVSDMDVVTFYKDVLRSGEEKKWMKQQRSTSALIFYWGMKGVSEKLGLHNILFAEDYKAEFTALFEKKVMYPDPTIYIFISSKKLPSDAPTGHENWFVMVNAPENTGQDWEQMIMNYKKVIIEKIQKMLAFDVANNIVCEKIQSPLDIEKNTGSYRGSLYGSSSNSPWSAFLRHKNRHKKIRNLFFAGGSVHPGGGIPLCIASANMVAEIIGNSAEQ